MWRRQRLNACRRSPLEQAAEEGDSPVAEHARMDGNRVGWTGISGRTREGRPPKSKYVQGPIAYQYSEGKSKRTA